MMSFLSRLQRSASGLVSRFRSARRLLKESGGTGPVSAETAPSDSGNQLPYPLVFPESALAHRYCLGAGLEIGGSAHNPFGLNTRNVDLTAELTVYKKEEIKLCGKALRVDIVAPGDAIPLPSESQDFIVSSHVLEHFPDPIGALLEWDRLVRPGGIIFMIVPHRERTFDRSRERTPLAHLIDDFSSGRRTCHEGPGRHEHVWITEDVVELVNWIIENRGVSWRIEEVQDVDDKVGNGFAVVIRKVAGAGSAGPLSA